MFALPVVILKNRALTGKVRTSPPYGLIAEIENLHYRRKGYFEDLHFLNLKKKRIFVK